MNMILFVNVVFLVGMFVSINLMIKFFFEVIFSFWSVDYELISIV